MDSPSSYQMASVTGSTKRSPSISGGKRGQPTTHLRNISLTPLDPVDPEIRKRLALNSPHELLQCFVFGTNEIQEGDVLVVDSIEYPVRSVGNWSRNGEAFLHLIIEELKR